MARKRTQRRKRTKNSGKGAYSLGHIPTKRQRSLRRKRTKTMKAHKSPYKEKALQLNTVKNSVSDFEEFMDAELALQKTLQKAKPLKKAQTLTQKILTTIKRFFT